MRIEQIPQKLEKPSLMELEKRINDNQESTIDFLNTGVVKMEACVERNQKAMQVFCENNRGFGEIIKTHKLTIITEK